MPEFLKNFFDKMGRKGAQNLVLMLLLGVALLIASAYFANASSASDSDAANHIPWMDIEPVVQTHSTSLSAYLAREMEEILSLVAGAGEVRVMLTMGSGTNIFARNSQENVAATTEDDGEGGMRSIHSVNSSITYVMVRQSDGSEAPLMLQDIGPGIEGIIIVAQGGGDVAVRDALTRAAQAVLGVAPHRVLVLQMR